jgi:hypothetical protein
LDEFGLDSDEGDFDGIEVEFVAGYFAKLFEFFGFAGEG